MPAHKPIKFGRVRGVADSEAVRRVIAGDARSPPNRRSIVMILAFNPRTEAFLGVVNQIVRGL